MRRETFGTRKLCHRPQSPFCAAGEGSRDSPVSSAFSSTLPRPNLPQNGTALEDASDPNTRTATILNAPIEASTTLRRWSWLPASKSEPWRSLSSCRPGFLPTSSRTVHHLANIHRRRDPLILILDALQNAMNTTTPSPSPVPVNPSPSQSSPSAGTKRKRNTGSRYYAVKVGFQPGIYHAWNDCLAQVTGYKGAVCKFVRNETRGVLASAVFAVGYGLMCFLCSPGLSDIRRSTSLSNGMQTAVRGWHCCARNGAYKILRYPTRACTWCLHRLVQGAGADQRLRSTAI